MERKKRAPFMTLACLLTALPALAACANATPQKPDPDPKPEEHEYSVRFEKEHYYLSATDRANTLDVSAAVYRDGIAATELKATYTCADPTIATVSGEGVLQAVSAGQTYITATYLADGATVSDTAAVDVLSPADQENVNAFREDSVNLYGRTYLSGSRLTLDNVCTGVEVAFRGTSLKCTFRTGQGKIRVYVDGDTEGTDTIVKVIKGTASYTLCENLPEGAHVVKILKGSSAERNLQLPAENAFETDGTFLIPPKKSELKIEVIGDSITEGYGSMGTSADRLPTLENSDATKAYACVAMQELGADFSIMALAGICVKDSDVNGLNLYTRYSPYKETAYDPASFDADLTVLALGENDMWHATDNNLFPDYNVEKFQADYAEMLRTIRAAHPDKPILCIFGMMPASSTPLAKQTIEAAVADTGFDKIYTMQMLSNEQGGISHPNQTAHAANAKTLVEKIREIMEIQT